jgi:2-keto-4-pentenoate hydratase/2-oxohepta-3-ene-1,7-dioic acid hydratase in catechol pathway
MSWYALATVAHEGASRPALVLQSGALDLAQCWQRLRGTAVPAWCANVNAAIADWAQAEEPLARLAEDAGRDGLAAQALAAPHYLPAFCPTRIFGAASNYIEHANEMQTALAAKAESMPYMFMKATSSVIGTGDTIRIPPETERADWEVELGVVLGRKGRRIAAERAAEHIAGYVVVNDVSARDMNRRSDFPFKHDWFRGKSWDTFCPIGPWFVPRACVADPHRLRLWLRLNGEMMQDGSTAEMIFDCYEQISYLSMLLTVGAGDLVMTGTPAGVGMGRDLYLKPGDRIECGIEGLGELVNPVAAEETV